MKNDLLVCLENRKTWYRKSIDMKNGDITWENGFNFPEGNIDHWTGAEHELENTIHMMEVKSILNP